MFRSLASAAVASALVAIGLVAGCAPVSREGGDAAGTVGRMGCPAFVDIQNGIAAEIVSVRLSDEIQGMDRKLVMPPVRHQERLKFCTVTLRITKPAGRRLTLAAADLTAHFWRRDEPQVTSCLGLSPFSIEKDSFRPMQFMPTEGFLFIRASTGASTTPAAEVFVDAVFPFVPADAGQLWICLGQPIGKQPYVWAAPQPGT
jgi:hypothetical protein